MITIYHNSRCKKSRAGLKYLQENKIEFKVRDYFKEPLTAPELVKLLIKLNIKAFDLVRTQEPYYKTDLNGKRFTEEEWIKLMIENPKLIKRPIIEAEYKAVIAEKIEDLEKFFKKKKYFSYFNFC